MAGINVFGEHPGGSFALSTLRTQHGEEESLQTEKTDPPQSLEVFQHLDLGLNSLKPMKIN